MEGGRESLRTRLVQRSVAVLDMREMYNVRMPFSLSCPGVPMVNGLVGLKELPTPSLWLSETTANSSAVMNTSSLRVHLWVALTHTTLQILKTLRVL